MQSLKTPILIILFFFVCLFLLPKLFGPIPFTVHSITTTKNDLFRVDGQGEATAVPDTAQFSVGVTKTAPTVEAGQNQVNTVSKEIIANLQKLGINKKDITTTNYSVYPNYQYSPNGQQTTNGFTVTQNLEVEVKDMSKANQAIDIATAAGANQVGGITFVLSDDTREKLEQQAQEEAIKKAKAKAVSLAKAAGIRLGKIVDIQAYPTQDPTMNKYAPAIDSRSGLGGVAEPETTITPGESSVNVTVSLGYETL